ncbi:MAG: DNA starvation/stationary phase protection protein Dps [Pseudomonadota bacterium]
MPENFAGGLSDNARQAAVDILNPCLATTIDLTLCVKQAHWNLKGSSFIGLHELLDTQAEMLRDQADTIAERCVILGGLAQGTSATVVEASDLEPYPQDIVNWSEHVSALKERYMTLGARLRKAIPQVADAGDEDTADVLTGASRLVDKGAWFIGAHNEQQA